MISRWAAARETQDNRVPPAESPANPENSAESHTTGARPAPPRPAPRGSLRRHFRSTVIRFRVRLSRLLFQTAGGAALSAFPAPGAPEPRYRRAKRCAVPGRPRGGDPGPGRRGVAPRASAAVPGRREPELRRSATPLPGRPVHLAGEGGRCQ